MAAPEPGGPHSPAVVCSIRAHLSRWHIACSIDSGAEPAAAERRIEMLWTIFVILLVLWLLGMVSSYTMGGFIHVLLILAIGILLIRLIQGRNPVV